MGRDEEIGSVVKAFNVLQVFSETLPKATITQVAEKTGYTRPTARRILLTCVSQQFMATDGKYFWLTPKVMRLGFGYLSALPFWEMAQPHMRVLAEELDESCSLATLDGAEIVYLARVPVRRGMIPLQVGSRLPAHATALGKALLAFADPATVEDFLAGAPYEELTPNTITRSAALAKEFEQTRSRGFAVNEGEREIGVRSIAAPVLDRSGVAVAALNISVNAVRVSETALTQVYAPKLLETARTISSEIAFVPSSR